MPDLIILYWRDIPAQVIAKAGRQSAKRELPLHFTEAIDMAAMRGGLRESDAYLEQWRRGDPTSCGEDLEAEAQACMDRLLGEYDDARLKALVAGLGSEPKPT